MRALLAFAALSIAIALPATAAQAAERTRPQFVAAPSAPFHGDFRNHRRIRGFGDTIYIDREYQGDTAWRSTSFNDWWHEQPQRSFPRWMQNNSNCERKWWGGDALRC